MIEWNLLSFGFVAIYVVQLAFVVYMELLNRRHVKRIGSAVPDSMRDFIDEEKLAAINAYSLGNSSLFLVRKIGSDLLLLGFILTGFLQWVNGSFSALHYIAAGLAFFLLVGAIFFLLELPFDYYDTFVLEEKYGFNRSDVRTWALDNVKGAMVSVCLLVIIAGPLLWTIHVSPNYWWLLGFLVVSLIQFLLVVLYPVVIAPLFNKFEPLKDTELAEKVQQLVRATGMRTEGIFQMDAGRRSAHSNAYFTGLGKTKRVVLFDTLINSHTQEEILGVLAHELGHFKLRHVPKMYLVSLGAMLAGFYATYWMLNWAPLYQTFNFEPGQYQVGLLLIGILLRKLTFFLRPMAAGMSRRFERGADVFAAALLEDPGPLVTSLKKLASHNLANLNPHPFYVWFYYSHPPLLERVEYLESGPVKILP
jgi:STE24 endopeptidase